MDLTEMKINKLTASLPTFKKRVGKRFSILDTNWSSQSANWINSTNAPVSVMTFNSNYATIKGIDTTLLQQHLYSPFKTVSKRTTIRAKVQCVNGSVAGEGGLVMSLFSINPNNRCSFQMQILTDPNDAAVGRVCFYTNQTLTKLTGSAKLPLAIAGDIFEITITSDNTAVYVKVNNITQKGIISHVYRWDAQSFNPVNIFQVGFSSLGGVWNILELECTDNEVVKPDLLIIGDSLASGVTGVSNMKTGRDYPSILAQRFPNNTISRWCGGGDCINLYVESKALSELLLRRPKYALIMMGLNDVGLFGRTLVQLQNDYITLVSALKARGTIIIHGGLIPNNAKDVRPFNNWVRSTYSNDLLIDAFSPLAEVGVSPIVTGSTSFGLNAFWLADSTTHMNEAGDFRLADAITMFLIEHNIFNPSQMLNIVP